MGAARQETLTAMRPYAPSWVDRLTDWIERLPFPNWVFYLAWGGILVAIGVGFKWADGSYQIGTIHPYHIIFISLSIVAFATMHFLDNSARAALEEYRPALTVSEAEYQQLKYKLTTMPALPTLLWTLACLIPLAGSLLSAIDYFYTPLRSIGLFQSPVSGTLEMVMVFMWWLVAGPFFYHTYRQLRIISEIHARHTQINLFRLRPLYSLSKLTAQTAAIISLILYVAILAAPRLYSDPLVITSIVALAIVTAAIAIVPLWGIHRQLAQEKTRVQNEASQRLEATLDEFDRRLDAGQNEGMLELKAAIEGHVLRQNFLDKIPTWPWSADTIRLLATAVLLPLVLYLTQRLVQWLLDL